MEYTVKKSRKRVNDTVYSFQTPMALIDALQNLMHLDTRDNPDEKTKLWREIKLTEHIPQQSYNFALYVKSKSQVGVNSTMGTVEGSISRLDNSDDLNISFETVTPLINWVINVIIALLIVVGLLIYILNSKPTLDEIIVIAGLALLIFGIYNYVRIRERRNAVKSLLQAFEIYD